MTGSFAYITCAGKALATDGKRDSIAIDDRSAVHGWY